MRRVFSMNWWWERVKLLAKVRHIIDPFWRELLINLPRPSIRRIHIKGYSGPFCHMPLEGLKVSDGDSLTRMENKYEEIRDMTH